MAVDQILTRFKSALAEMYGPALDRVVLFGSRARGDARLADLRTRFLDEGGPPVL
jgi:predicted nucleotidyltransferase